MVRYRLKVWHVLEALVLAAALLLAVPGMMLLPLTTSAYVQAMVGVVGSVGLTGLGEGATLETAEHVRRFVTDASTPPLPGSIAGREAYDEAAVLHLVDVRNVLVPARWAALALTAALIAWAAFRWRSLSGRLALARALAGSGWVLVAGVVLLVALGTEDFGALFTRFHNLFFAPGTWQFPYDALLIRVFPLPFWILSGVVWGLLSAGAGGGMIVAARRIRFTASNIGV